MGKLGDRPNLKVNQVCNAGKLCVLAGRVDGIPVDVIALKIAGNREIDFAAKLLADFCP